MELQSGLYGLLSKGLQGFPSKIVLQQKGLNQFSQSGFGGYARIIIGTEVGKPGDYQPLSGQRPPSADELKRVDRLLSSLVRQDATAMTGGRVLAIQPSRVTKLGDVYAVVCEYRRQINDNPAVHAFRYYVQNNDRVHTVILSYREQDQAAWEPVYRQVVQTFRFLDK